MIILHAGFNSDQFLLWGEKSLDTTKLSNKGSNKTKDILTHPFMANTHELRETLKICSLLEYSACNKTNNWIAWLPSSSNNPIPSDPILTKQIEEIKDSKIYPWQINALSIRWGDIICFLSSLIGKSILARGVLIGTDLAFWVTAMRFAIALVIEHKFIPDVIRKQDKWHAKWEPVINGKDKDKLIDIAKAMPSSCRAITSIESKTSPDKPALELLTEFVCNLVDLIVRKEACQTDELGKTGCESIHDEWFKALTSENCIMENSGNALSEFAAEVKKWHHQITSPGKSSFKLCFRIEEPDDMSDRWNVRYFLQSVDDPSLMISSHEALTEKYKKLEILKQSNLQLREFLLSSLGRASGLCPSIEESLKTSIPSGYDLDSSGAYEFLRQKAQSLEQAGFSVILPAWWTGKGTKLRLSAKADIKSPKMQGGSSMDIDSILNFNWKIALGNKDITLEELKALARIKSPLVKMRGEWVHVSAGEIQQAIDFWKKRSSGSLNLRDIVKLSLGGVSLPQILDFDGVNATGWISDMLNQLKGQTKFEEVPVIDEFSGTLRPYQIKGYSWLSFLKNWGLGACLADDMGLGKTIQTLALIQRDWQNNKKQPVLIICPTSVMENWKKEASKFTPNLPVLIHHGNDRLRGTSFYKKIKKKAIVISSYSLIYRDFDIFKDVNWAGIILDEAQNIKNPETKQAKSSRSLKSGYRIALTGTPVENNVGDLWSIMEFLNPGFLGTQTEFKKQFFEPIQVYRDSDAAKKLKNLTGPFMLRRLKTDSTIISDLPKKMEMKVFCSLTKEQASLYTVVTQEVEDALKSAEGIKRRGLILATLSKLKQICNHPVQFLKDNSSVHGRSGKLERLTEMLEEVLAVNDKALIFSQFSEMGEILQKYLEENFGKKVLFLHGGVPRKHREKMIECFGQEDGPPIFVLSLKAGGIGLNLTSANHVFHFDRWWNPAVENQATDRAFRIGQTKNVQVHKFLCSGTFEEKIDEMIERKKAIADEIVGTGEAWLTELSNQKIKQLFALREEIINYE